LTDNIKWVGLGQVYTLYTPLRLDESVVTFIILRLLHGDRAFHAAVRNVGLPPATTSRRHHHCQRSSVTYITAVNLHCLWSDDLWRDRNLHIIIIIVIIIILFSQSHSDSFTCARQISSLNSHPFRIFCAVYLQSCSLLTSYSVPWWWWWRWWWWWCYTKIIMIQ